MVSRRERAFEVLKDHTDDFIGRKYIEAIANETLPQYFLDRFQWFHLYSDDLPGERLVDVWHPDYPLMKCRGNVIYGISGELRNSVKDGVIKSSDIIDKVEYYRKYNWNFQKEAKGEYWTNQEEIDLINGTLEAVIGYLKQNYSVKDNIELLKIRFQEDLIHVRKMWQT